MQSIQPTFCLFRPTTVYNMSGVRFAMSPVSHVECSETPSVQSWPVTTSTFQNRLHSHMSWSVCWRSWWQTQLGLECGNEHRGCSGANLHVYFYMQVYMMCWWRSESTHYIHVYLYNLIYIYLYNLYCLQNIDIYIYICVCVCKYVCVAIIMLCLSTIKLGLGFYGDEVCWNNHGSHSRAIKTLETWELRKYGISEIETACFFLISGNKFGMKCIWSKIWFLIILVHSWVLSFEVLHYSPEN